MVGTVLALCRIDTDQSPTHLLTLMTNDLADEDYLFLEFIEESDADILDEVSVDDGRIQFGSCDKIQVSLNTQFGDGLYPIWVTKSGNYVVIELNQLKMAVIDEVALSELPEEV